ncbi:MAG: hypothetical protein H0T79_17040 [Deltaproteobacteria bacterium]|nr:hypothetical protein [Deltaproteobacteria bacterium]
MTANLPPCGLYRTASPVANVPAGRLVYFHNHGNPGPGIYLPEKWTNNRAHFAPNGHTMPTDFDPAVLLPVPPEGFYRVTSAFHCCEKKCVQYEPEAFVQLGYNGAGRALLFVPELGTGSIDVPDRGTFIDDTAFPHLSLLQVAERKAAEGAGNLSLPRGIVVH